MAFNIKTTIQAIASYLQASGYFQTVNTGEPKSPPTGKLNAAVFMDSVNVVQLTLATTIEIHAVIIRIYINMMSDPEEQIEYQMAEAVSKVSSDLIGEYDLGATIRNVDAGGAHSSGLRASWGYLELGGIIYRIVDMYVPLLVDDSATFAA